MTTGGQSQKGGQGSQQLQVAGDYIVNVGVTEERAREIARQTSQEVIQQYAVEATELVECRIASLDKRVVSVLSLRDRLDSFSDPSFIRTYKKAQAGAAASERESDYDMLAALLSQRADRPRERPVRAGIERAIEIVDQVDDDALRGLTVVYALGKWIPSSPDIGEGVRVMESIFAELLDGPLPKGRDWIEHLDILDAVRTNSLTEFKRFDDYYPAQLQGYVAPGVADGEVPSEIGGVLGSSSWDPLIVKHELRPGYVRFKAIAEHVTRKDLKQRGVPDVAIDGIVNGAVTTFGLGTIDDSARLALVSRLRAEPTIGAVAGWWDSLPYYFSMTAVGRALATANAFRLDVDERLPRKSEAFD